MQNEEDPKILPINAVKIPLPLPISNTKDGLKKNVTH